METQSQMPPDGPTLMIDIAQVALRVEKDLEGAHTLTEYAEAFEVIDPDTAGQGAQWRNQINARIKAVQDTLARSKRAAHEAHAAICALENKACAPLREAQRIMDSKLAAWQQEQERLRRIEEARRLEAERRAEEERRLAEAEALEAAGEPEQAVQVIEEPQIYTPPPAPAPKVQGVQFRETWSAKVINMTAFVKACAENPALINLLVVNQVALTAMARAQKAQLRIPGVQPICQKQVASARR